MKRILCGCLALFLAACGQEKTAHASYGCEKGVSFRVDFLNGEKAIVTTDDNPVTLIRVESSSGAKYENEGVMLETMGADATFVPRKDEKPLKCRRG